MTRFLFSSWAISFLLLAGCDGTVTTSGGSAGSGGASGGTGGMTTGGTGGMTTGGTGGMTTGGTGGMTTGGTGGQPEGCPANEPKAGDPCSLAQGETCKYGDFCCPNVWGCQDGAFQQYDVDCGAPASCPAEMPADGAPCGDICAQWSPCAYACDGTSAPLATCIEGTWIVQAFPCSDPVPCGDSACTDGDLCVETIGGAGFFYSCQPNPCAGQPLSCECAGSICGGDPYVCEISNPTQLTCNCPFCP